MSLTKRLLMAAGLASILTISSSSSKADDLVEKRPLRWAVPEWQSMNYFTGRMGWPEDYKTDFEHINYKNVYLRLQFVPGTNRALEVKSLEATVPKGYGLERLAFDLSKLISSDYLDQEIEFGFGIKNDSQYWKGFKVDWHDIYKQNKDLIGPNPDKVPEGLKLKYVTPMIPVRGPIVNY